MAGVEEGLRDGRSGKTSEVSGVIVTYNLVRHDFSLNLSGGLGTPNVLIYLFIY